MRAAFAAIVVFEFLNWLQVLHFQLTFSWFGLMITAAVVWGIVEFLWRKLETLHATKKGWLLFFILASLLIDLLGDVLGWYGSFLWYDQFAHFFGGISVAIAVVIVLRATNVLSDVLVQPQLSFGTQLLIVVALVTLFGVFYELEEYAETVILKNNRLGDMLDTPNDVLLNLLGSIAGGTLSLKNVHQPFARMMRRVISVCRAVLARKK